MPHRTPPAPPDPPPTAPAFLFVILLAARKAGDRMLESLAATGSRRPASGSCSPTSWTRRTAGKGDRDVPDTPVAPATLDGVLAALRDPGDRLTPPPAEPLD